MRLTHISVEGVGRFEKAVTVLDLAPGLNVLAAPNEAGKSTLFKAVRACVFEKHSARTDFLRALACETANLPVSVEIGFEHGGENYVARKSFLSSARASLSRGGKEIATGKTADEMLHETLGLKQGGGRSIDSGAFGLLWVGQSQSFQPPAVQGAAKDAIDGAIEREVGSLVGGERAREALKTLEAELATFLTAKGTGVSKSGPLGLAEARLQDLTAKLDADEALLAGLDRDIGELERKRRERERLNDPTVEADLRARLEACLGERAQAQAVAAELRDLEKDEKIARARLDETQRVFDELRQCAARIDETHEKLTQARGALAPLTQDETDRAQALRDARDELASLEDQDTRDAQAETHLRRLASAASAAASKPALQAKLALLERIAAELSAAKAARLRVVATTKDLQSIETMDRDIALLRDRLDAAAPRIDITPAVSPAAAIRIGGKIVADAQTYAATAPMRIAIDGVGEITVTPPPGFGEVERDSLRALEAKRAKQLALSGATSVAELREAIERARELDQKLVSLRAQLAALDATEASLPNEIALLRAKIDAADAAVAETMGAEEPPPLSDIEAKQAALQAKRALAAPQRKRLQAAIEAHGERLRTLATARAEQRGLVDALARQLDRDMQRLPAGERAQKTAEAAGAFDEARRGHERARLSLDALRARAPDAERMADMDARVARMESAIHNLHQEARALEDQISRLEGAILVRGGEGLGERVSALREERDLAHRDAERLRARLSALTLLRDTIRQFYEEQRELLQTPIRRHLQPFLDDVFAKAELTLDETFSISRLMRDGAPEAFQRLSDGTQEQIAVLVRLAMGGLLHERGEDVPIILDDALVFSDDERIERMFDALNRAARRQQVIVLTCRGASFRSLGGKALTITPLERSLR